MATNKQGYRLYDEDGLPINSSNPLPVSINEDPLTITVNIGSAVGINTSTVSNPVPVTATSLPLPTGSATDQSLTDLAGLIRILMMQLNSPVWLNIANNALQAYLIGGTTAVTGTLTGVTTVTGLTNIGGYSADRMTFDTSAIQWATSVRGLLT